MAKRNPLLTPHTIRGSKDVWWYETKRGAEVVVQLRDHAGQFIGGTIVTIPWLQLLRAAARSSRHEVVLRMRRGSK